MMEPLPAMVVLVLLFAIASCEHIRDLEISEGAPVGTRIGFIGDGGSADSGPPYLIVPVGNAVDTDLAIDHTTGEIRTKVPLDRETLASYSLVAIPMSGDNVKVVVKVLDENDNAPTFPSPVMSVEFPENTPRDVKRTLNPARDLDLDVYNTQRYNIVSGNVNNAFRLSSHRERDGVLYLDLQINGFLDRETTSSYSLVIEALDGGTPPLRGEMTVNITIQDVNDNPPSFNQSRYFATVPENATIGTSVLQVYAIDADADENGQVEYSINRRQSDRESMFGIDPTTGAVTVNKPLDFETKELHELVIVARDHGVQPLEATAFVSIKVTDVNDNQPTINVIFLSEDATPKISESAQPGEFVARISVHDPDSKTEYSNVNVTLSGGDGHFGLTTRDNIIYLMIVSLPLDREMKPNYTLNVEATDTGTPPLHASRTIDLQVTDINDNAPEFEQPVYHANVMEVSDPGTSVVHVLANDKDEGNNSAITYSILDAPGTRSNWFEIDSKSGLVKTRAHVDCETDPVPQVVVVATDNGFPPLSSSATVLVTIHDVNDNEPIFDRSFYNVSVAENEPRGHCVLKVTATDPDCGVNAVVNYTIGDGFGKLKEFKVRSDTGEICISSKLDFETRNTFEFPVIATDRGGLSTVAIVKVQVTDVNDNQPVFQPSEYNVSLREGAPSSATQAVAVVSAVDPDTGKFGAVVYKIVAGNEAGVFRIDRNTGEVFVSRPGLLSARNQPFHRLNVSATDGGNLRSRRDAEVFVSVVDPAQRPPVFERPRYAYAVPEDAKRGAVVGNVKASLFDNDGRSNIRYSIYSGDPGGLFKIDPVLGTIRIAASLDHESRANVLLNVQATNGEPPVYGHTQVNVQIEDVNDNPPEFFSGMIRISIPENADVGVALYAAHADDKDSGQNGVVRYKLAINSQGLFKIDPKLGDLTLTRHLDYETTQRHSLIITATDMGIPPLSANLTVLVEVQDINDNPPVFERSEYTFSVLESLPVNSQILQLTAVDADTGNNARITYRLLNSTDRSVADVFGVFPNSGWLYLRGNLDRETNDRYQLNVGATDNGSPSQMATTRISVRVLDANDNDPVFSKGLYEFSIEENLGRDTPVGVVEARDADAGVNAEIRYSLIPGNSSFAVDAVTGEITTKQLLDREQKQAYDLVVEAKDQGSPPRSTRVALKISILDINDNAPEIVDPQEDVVSVREEQPPGTEVVRIRAVDLDEGNNASITYSLTKNRESDGYGVFTIDPSTGVIKTRMVLDHEEKTIYRLAVSATDGGNPPKQTTRMLRVEVLDLNDNRPTFTSSSLTFKVKENVQIGYVVGSIAAADSSQENSIAASSSSYITYTLTSLKPDEGEAAFEIDRGSGSLVVARELDKETHSEYRMEVRALDTSAMNNPQSSAITVKIDVVDVNDNYPKWSQDPITISVSESTEIGTSIYNFTATDADSDNNGDLRYSLVKPSDGKFNVDSLTGTLVLTSYLDFEDVQEYTLIVRATDQAFNVSERLSTTVTVRVIVTDFNDNPPKFVVPTTSTAIISDTLVVGMKITHLIAVDADTGDNGRVTYILSGGNAAGLFSLGYDTGILTLAKPLPTVQKSFTLNVTANDHGTPTRKATTELKLMVLSNSNSPPKFLEPQYVATVAEDASVGTEVMTVMAKSGISVENENITFVIPHDMADNTFEIQSPIGKIRTKKLLDRERANAYTFPLYITDSSSSSQTLFDITTVVIRVQDINDNAPSFQSGSCQRMSLPENGDTSIVHTVIAEDLDLGANGEVRYSITNGNTGNKFNINPTTGELTAKPLDRESHSRYHLTIMVQDKGNPPLHSTCNLTILVEDQNDNDPKFDLSKYSTTIFEDVPVDTSVMKVHATDADIGINAKIIYSLANESQWLFQIDNKTGIITTAGLFDREKQSSYTFLVVATDGGKYNARSQTVPIVVKILDVNDNQPIFALHPFRERVAAYIQPGQTILKVTARDADEGTNAEIVYNLVNDVSYAKFRINPNTGVLTSTQSLASYIGKVIYLGVQATDKGNPPKSSSGLIEIVIGDLQENSPQLKFQNETYTVTIPENLEQFRDVLQVNAVRTDGRRQKIVYSFGMGNEDNAFIINSDSGMIQVRDPKFLDYELHKEMNMIIEAKTDVGLDMRGFCNVTVKLTDQNDNAPKFTQQQYSASVWEGNKKGAFVLQVVAFDADEGSNSKLLYHIVDGNHDNAFMIEPAFSGIVKTNTVLDREIRDTYRLTVIATDLGVPQMTGTTRIRINVVDVNDNQPTFPPHSIITVKEDTSIGTVLTIVTANDVDTHPALTYDFSKDNNDEDLEYFSINRYSGKVILKKALDFETWQEYKIKIVASDVAHTARTILTIKVIDVNDNAPVFSQSSYQTTLPDGQSPTLTDIVELNATDADSDKNGQIRYSIVNQVSGFSIGPLDGILRTNLSNVSTVNGDVLLTVKAMDLGTPPLNALVSVRVRVNPSSNSGEKSVKKMDYKLNIPENTPRGTAIIHLSKPSGQTHASYFNIIHGNEDRLFEVSNPSGAVVLVNSLDREIQDAYNIKVSSEFSPSSFIHILIQVEDSNDNAPVFQQTDYEKSISENLPIGTSIETIFASDADLGNSPNSEIVFDITSGNNDGYFRIEAQTGLLSVNKTMDYDIGNTDYNLVVRACDKGTPMLCTLNNFLILLQDENDNEPKFPVSEYLEFVGENEPVGTAIFTAHATDLDKGYYGNLNYTILSSNNYAHLDNSWKLFHIDSSTGLVSTATVFDYEQRSRYNFVIKATDTGGKSSTVKVRLEIDGKDEFHPQFTEKTYRLTLPTSAALPAGYVIGHVTATDRDKGSDGRVVYQLTTQHPFFKINRTTGDILIKKKFESAELLTLGREISLVVTASSGRQGSLTNMTVVEIILDPLADPGTNLAVNQNSDTTVSTGNGGIADWALGLLIALILLIITFGAVFVFLHMRNKRNKKVNKPNLNSEAVSNANNYVDPSAFDTIPVQRSVGPMPGGNNQFAPPKYDEIPPYGGAHTTSSNSGAATTSELSGSEQSGSSGRGSAEDGDDGEDEEIRMINEGPLQRDSGIHRQNDDDNLSDVSVRNTQQYLARLGIINNSSTSHQQGSQRLCTDPRAGSSKESLHHHQAVPLDNLHIFDEEVGNENDITNLIYSKLNDVAGSDRASSADEGGGVNTSTLGSSVDHVMGIGNYGEVPAVTHQPSMNGSLSSIVHSEEELAGSYNWDYLLDWGPQYQPLAHVFSEIARLKDDTASIHSGASGASSVKSKNSVAPTKNIPPPLITSVAPRSIVMPVLNSRGGSGHHSNHNQMMMLPRSPINHDASGATFNTSTAMSPSFSPSLSPLATKSPSISPLVAPGLSTAHHVMPRQPVQNRNKSVVDTELRV